MKSFQNNLEVINKSSKPFAAFIKNEQDHHCKIYLVNPTNQKYARVVNLTGAFSTDDGDLVETNMVMREIGELPEHSYKLLEEGESYNLDFVIWYHIDLYNEQSPEKPEKAWFDLPKYGRGYNDTISYLPVLNTKGMIIELKNRKELL